MNHAHRRTARSAFWCFAGIILGCSSVPPPRSTIERDGNRIWFGDRFGSACLMLPRSVQWLESARKIEIHESSRIAEAIEDDPHDDDLRFLLKDLLRSVSPEMPSRCVAITLHANRTIHWPYFRFEDPWYRFGDDVSDALVIATPIDRDGGDVLETRIEDYLAAVAAECPTLILPCGPEDPRIVIQGIVESRPTWRPGAEYDAQTSTRILRFPTAPDPSAPDTPTESYDENTLRRLFGVPSTSRVEKDETLAGPGVWHVLRLVSPFTAYDMIGASTLLEVRTRIVRSRNRAWQLVIAATGVVSSKRTSETIDRIAECIADGTD